MFTLRQLTSLFSSFIIMFSLTFSAFQPVSVSAQGEDGVERQVNAESGRVSFISPESGSVLSASRVLGTFVRPQDPAMALAKRFGPEFGLKNPTNELSEIKTDLPKDGRMIVRYQQNYQGIPVIGGELIVNTNQNGDLYSMNGEVSPDLALQTQPNIDSAQARDSALQAVAKWYQKAPTDFIVFEPALWIFDESLLQPSPRPVELVWRMEVTSINVSMAVRELVLVNAQKGSISLHFNQIDTAWASHAIGEVNGQDNHPIEITTAENTSALSSDVNALVAATLYVATNGNDSNSCTATGSPCLTINGAIGKSSDGDTIKVATGTYTGSGEEVVLINNKNITLSGDWNATFTTQSGTSIIDGQGTRRGIKVLIGTVTVDHFTIQNGFHDSQGGGLYHYDGALTINNSTVKGNVSQGMGGGIFNYGTLTINNTSLTGNKAGDPCCTSGGGGGGIRHGAASDVLTLNNSLVANNTLLGGYQGSGIDNTGIVILNDSTVSGNAGGNGVGINTGGGTLVLNNSTISENQSYGISSYGNITLQNTIIARNGINGDCSIGDTINSQGYNLIGNNLGCVFVSNIGDLVGTSANPINPLLTPLQDNGGSTHTHALMVGSPAINMGNPATPGSGGNACLATDQRDTARPVDSRCDIGAYEGSAPFVPSPYVNTYTAGYSSSLPGTLLCNESQPNCTNGNNPDADAAHKYAIGTYNLYLAQFNRNSIDNSGMVITSTVHYCDPSCPYENAFWSGSQVVYGESFSLADDVVAHELTHGVTQYESNLFYYYQSGAINESFSDVFGEYYDQTNGLGNDTAGVKWLVGEDVTGIGALRSMSNPPAYGDPDKITSPSYYKDSDDSGGVHANSGINNKATFLMVDGGTFNGKTVTALGWVKTAAIYYEAQTNLLSSGADYSDLYYALQQACTNLIGQKGITSGNCLEVKDAVDAVEMNLQPVANFNTDAPFCDTGATPNSIFHDDLESGISNWTFNNGADTRWQYDSPYGAYAHSGTHFLFANDYPGTITDATARLTPVVIPASAYLSFYHAYDFEKSSDASTYYDGGVLEYSVNGGSTWLDAASLIDYNGYIGVINSNYGNPLANRSAFAGTSHGYISTRLNLASLAGQSVIFHWRMGLDDGTSRWGWWLDDVQVYTCSPVRPYVVSSVPASANPNNATNVNFTVTFSESVTGINTSAPFSDFMLTTSGVSGASITSVTGSGATRTVAVNTGTGSGTIRLDVLDNDNIINGSGNKLGGTGLNNGNFNSGGIYTIDKTVPTVSSITRSSSNPTSATSLNFNVTFSEAVSAVDTGDFTLSSSGVVGATISSVTGSGATRIVKVKTGTGDGTIRVNLVDDNTILDSASNPLGGAGAGNGNFTTGEIYTIDKPDLQAPMLRSPQSNVAMNNTLPTFWWTNVTGSQNYEIVFATDSAFSNIVDSEIVSGSPYTVISPFNDGKYYWRVRANNTSNQPGNWSGSRIITIDTSPLSAPVLSLPPNNASKRHTTMFKWQATSMAVAYEFQYDNDSNFSSPIYTVTTSSNFRRPPAMKLGIYYWRVRAKDAAGNWSAWSAPFTITIARP